MATVKPDCKIFDRNVAVGIAYVSAGLWAEMLATNFELRAGLHAVNSSMEHI
jgi:hypothetical protein